MRQVQARETVKLRGHHLICVRTFAGSGYGSNFTDNMHRVVDACSAQHQRITIVEGLDDVCGACPNSNGATCGKNPGLASELDIAILTHLGTKIGTSYEAAPLFERVERAMRRGEFYRICERCEWFSSFCHGILSGRQEPGK